MWNHLWSWLHAFQSYVARMDSWDWIWVVAIGVLIGSWSLRTMPIGSSQ